MPAAIIVITGGAMLAAVFIQLIKVIYLYLSEHIQMATHIIVDEEENECIHAPKYPNEYA